MAVTELMDGERLWRLTAEHSPLGMTLVSPEGVVLTANRSLCAMLRCTEEDLRGSDYRLLTHLDDRDRHAALFDEAVAGSREGYRLTKRCLRADGSVLWGELSVSVLRTETGATHCMIGQLVDVTPQRIHEQQLADAVDEISRHRKLAVAILDTVDVGLLLIDRHGHYTEFNRRHADLLGVAFPEGHRGRAGQLGLIFADDGTTPMESEAMPTSRAARGEEFDDYRIWIGPDPATRRAIAVSARAIYDDAGTFAGAAMAYNDITDLMRAIRARDDFLASVSHELRTPLASVVGYLEMLAESPEVGMDARRQVEVIRRNAGRLRDLVSDLLESAAHRAGPVAVTRRPTDLGLIAAEALEAALPSARARGVHLEGDILTGVLGDFDPGRVRQVLDNLISNGVKYSDAGDRVVIRLRAIEGEAVLRVSDTGIGMSAGDLSQLFIPFFRADAARERQAAGVGLGLGITRSIIDGHGGRIEVDSAPGEGTTFTVWFPLA